MDVIGITKQEQYQIFRLVAGILWLGNITFVQQGNQTVVEDENSKLLIIYLPESFKICCIFIGSRT
jgi:myosin-1